jgi:hypothetical protein
MSRPPIIIIGMHRSGTTMVTRLLQEMGLFTGWKLDENHEAAFFSKHNTWLLNSAGGRWDNPACIDYLYSDTEGVDMAVQYLRHRMSSVSCYEYFGLARSLKYRSIFNITEPWGWKDPRNTLTLPLWMRLFPEARVIHVVRNGIDVANSLFRRQNDALRSAGDRLQKHRMLYRIRAKQGWFGSSPRVLSRTEGFKLWEEYMEYAERFTGSIENPVIEVSYEEFVSDPSLTLLKLTQFSGLNPSLTKLQEVCSTVRRDRSYSFTKDEAARDLWESVRRTKWMARYGYNTCD